MTLPNPCLGFSTMLGSNALADLPQHLDLIASIGADVAELSALHDDLIVRHRILPGRLALLKSILKDRPLTYSVHAAIGLNFMVPAAQVAAHEAVAQAYIELSAEIGARHVVLHAGSYPGATTQAERDRLSAQQRAVLWRLGDFAQQHDCLVCVENVFYWDGEHTATPRELAAELSALNHPHVCATFDFAHAALNLEDVGDFLVAEAAALAPFSKHLHIHDNFGLRNRTRCYVPAEEVAFGEGDLHLPLHWGALPWDRLAQLAYPEDPLFMIELNPRFWREAEQMVEETRAWARAVLARV